MFKLSAVVHTRKKVTDQDVKRLLFHHPYIGMLLCCVIVPILILGAVSSLCYFIMLPISFFMGWL